MSNKDLLENIKKLREMTGVGFKDCKIALDETNGDIEKSIEFEILSSDLVIPNFFTPNNDGENDTWIITDLTNTVSNIYIQHRE